MELSCWFTERLPWLAALYLILWANSRGVAVLGVTPSRHGGHSVPHPSHSPPHPGHSYATISMTTRSASNNNELLFITTLGDTRVQSTPSPSSTRPISLSSSSLLFHSTTSLATTQAKETSHSVRPSQEATPSIRTASSAHPSISTASYTPSMVTTPTTRYVLSMVTTPTTRYTPSMVTTPTTRYVLSVVTTPTTRYTTSVVTTPTTRYTSSVVTTPTTGHTNSVVTTPITPSMSQETTSLPEQFVSYSLNSHAPSKSPPPSSRPAGLPLMYRLILYIVPPVGVVLLCLFCISFIVCCRKYRRIYRVRQHLMPLTDIEGSEDSDDDSLDDHNSSFQINSTSLSNLSTRPVLAFSEDEEY